MTPIEFKEYNTKFGPPSDLDESQCKTIPAHIRQIDTGTLDGAVQVIVAWQPSKEELEQLNNGNPIFISMIGGLAPHFLTTSFEDSLRC